MYPTTIKEKKGVRGSKLGALALSNSTTTLETEIGRMLESMSSRPAW
jgi:hypothetical protein